MDSFVSLYNGNIGRVVISEDTLQEMGRRYRYDGLNRLRIVEHRKKAGSGYVSVNEYGEKFDYDRDGNITNVLRWAKNGVMDSLKYVYYAGNNRLRKVTDTVSASAFSWDIDNQVENMNYIYDKTGNLTIDKSAGMRIGWTYYNKVKSIDSIIGVNSYQRKLEFSYDASGDRLMKYDLLNKRKEIYVRDAQGNVVAVYEVKIGILTDSLFTKEFNIYGTERIGYLEDRNYLGKKTKGKTLNLSPTTAMKTLPTTPPSITPLPTTPTFTTFLGGSGSSLVNIYFGKKRYELTDWLGNVRVVISDKKIPDNTGGNIVLNYKPEVLSIRDYYSFGSPINERYFEVTKYRYSFNGKEDIDKSFQDYGARYYNKLLGRFISADPLIVKQQKYAELSSYQFAGNKPIVAIDLDGREEMWNIYVQNKDGTKIITSLSKDKDEYELNRKKMSEHYGIDVSKYGDKGILTTYIVQDKEGKNHVAVNHYVPEVEVSARSQDGFVNQLGRFLDKNMPKKNYAGKEGFENFTEDAAKVTSVVGLVALTGGYGYLLMGGAAAMEGAEMLFIAANISEYTNIAAEVTGTLSKGGNKNAFFKAVEKGFFRFASYQSSKLVENLNITEYEKKILEVGNDIKINVVEKFYEKAKESKNNENNK
ncbi:MAG TPA: RHS repeat-associated core domain-containing protein [Bacteroidia bacterium]|nr:RHS repeat-associated core domain-containing protein [Bacteroidia bacterium]